MGKIIVKNIKGMGWKARIGLIAVFTLAFSVLFYQWHVAKEANAAGVAVGTAWSTINATAPATALPAATRVNTTSASTYTAGAGQSRLLLVAVYYELATASTATFNVTFGGVTVNQISTSGGTSNREHVWLGYIKDASIPTAASSVISGITCATASSITSLAIKTATYVGVDQLTPTSGANGNIAATATVASNAVVSYVVGGVTVVAHANGGTPATPTYTATPALTTNAAASNTTNHSTYVAESAQHTAASSYASGGISITYAGTTSARSAIAIGALRPATTALANGTAITAANVAPGSTQKIDGFAFNTTTAGSTDSITGLTVTSTGQAAIASMSIWNEAGTTQYFTTVNNAASDTWTFSGGTPIPVTNTAAQYQIKVTYKVRASLAAGNTATTARVTAFTGTNLTSGTDTADPALTVLNTHAASTWGTNTPGNNQVTLNWTYGTAGQSVVIVRYTGANTDIAKPTDGTAYTTGAAFGTGGTVRYVGPASTVIDSVGVTNGTTYYYKIFEYDAVNFYYNATDVWTAALTPISPDAVAPTVDAGFAATTPVSTLAIPITSFGATDNVGGSGVSGYMITTSATPPAAGAAGWTSTPPTSFTVAAAGSYTLYPWAKDAGANVSPVYGAPVAVSVDQTQPTITAFTITTPSLNLNIPITAFTGNDPSGIVGYQITTSATPPAVDDLNWLATAPVTFAVGADGTYLLYPWVKDGAGNVSAAFAPRSATVDATPPSGLALTFPADEAVAVVENVALTWSTATDTNGPVMYQVQISNADPTATYTQNSGWISGTSFSPVDGTDPVTPLFGLTKGERYTWSVKAKDAYGNETGWLTARTFSVTAPCVRNDPTITLLTPLGGIASTISTDAGTFAYNLRLVNNDTGDCGNTTFNLTITDTDTLFAFDDSTFSNGLTTNAITLQPSSETTIPVTARATASHDSGVERTIVTAAADAFHALAVTGFVQTTLNVVTCQPKVPLMIVGPDSGYLNRSGSMVYTITVKNTDTGAGCTPVVFNLSKTSESNSTDFNASQFSTSALTLNSGELGSATFTVSAKATAAKNAVNLSVLHLAAAAHTSPADVTVTSTVNNPMLHNSDNTGSTKWSVSGWGTPNGRYGEIQCTTCHVGGGGDTANIKRVNEQVFAPYTGTHIHFPGEGKPIAYRRYIGATSTQPVLGWDGTATPRVAPTSTKICEACHTYDATGANGVKAHPFATTATLGNHFITDGKDCTKCHKHNKGFGAANMGCNSCHGNPNAATITAANRYDVAPPLSYAGNTGTLTGTGQVSNDPKVGAHQTHLQLFNGFTNYSTVDARCQNCHGAIPTNYTHVDSNSSPVFQGMATRGGMAPTFNSAKLTCTNTYCHNPAASSVLKNAVNAGSSIFPSWTGAKYVGDTRKTQANCGVCHKSPGDTGFQPAGTHSGMTIAGTNCATCHEHDGDNQGSVGRRHMDGILYGGGNCDSCHAYQVGTWAAKAERSGVNEGKGAHEKHIAYLTSRYTVTLSPTTDAFGSGTSWTNVCGVCHNGAVHDMGETIPGTGRTISFPSAYSFGGTATYNGAVGSSSGTKSKVCFNISCHYFTSPVWSTY